MRIRLLLSYLLITLIAVSAVVLLARQGAVSEVRAFMFPGGMVNIEELATSLESYYRQNGSWSGVESLLRPPGRRAQRGRAWGMSGMGQGMMMNQRLRLADVNGQVVFDSQSDEALGHLSPAEISTARPLRVDSQTVGYLLAQGGMAFSRADETFLLGRLTRAALLAGLVAAVLSLPLALMLTHTLMQPVRALTRAARRLGAGDLSQRVVARGNDELAELGQAFNRMAASLQQAEESRRALTADIAHELRTPLAVQRAHLEALQDGIYPLTPENLQPILDQNLALTRLVDDLRTLALADSGQLSLERTPTPVDDLVRQAVERFRPQADQRRITLQLSLESIRGLTLNLDPLRVEQIISNLLSNALRYTPQGGVIRVSGDCQGRFVRLTVHDSGPGIPPEALPHIFERFYRADRARSRAEGGSGLGLAIARQLAQAHGGDLQAANHPQGGAQFTLSLPLNS